ncbi:MAG: tyrosine-type recombinase/integrase, partial [Ketobacter sp.]|nr:tyrosine-type recombinase/integrase [Ketobacter sp.]
MNHLLSKPVKTFFGHYLPIQKGLATNTINAYRDAIRLLLCFVADQINQSVDTLYIEQLNECQISAWLDHLEHTRSCSIPTRNARLAAIRSFFTFIARQHPQLMEQCQQVRAIPIKKEKTHYSPDYLEENEMQGLMDSVDLETPTGLRDQAMLLLFYNTGARVSEVVSLKLENLNLKGQAQVRLTGKGQKVRTCPLWPETVSAILDYLSEREAVADTDSLFLNAKGAPISRFGIRYVINK